MYFFLYTDRATWPDIIDAIKNSDTLHAQSQLLGNIDKNLIELIKIIMKKNLFLKSNLVAT